jgi:LuxR family quorum-sensing system transcriptional regulator CciR
MSSFQEVQTFIEAANRATDISELKSLLNDMSRALGFHYFALVHHIDIHSVPMDAVQLVEYPATWAEKVVEKDYFGDDPVNAACQKMAAGFRWSQIGNVIDLTSRQKEILQSASQEGLGEGFTVPVHIPGEYAGSCSFSVRSGRDFPDEAVPALQYAGIFSFEAARRIFRKSVEKLPPAPPPRLTDRQLDCLLLVARGKSDWDTGHVLGISDQTVHSHIENAKRKYGVSTRTQLVTHALFDASLTFADVMRGQHPLTRG